MSNVFRLLNNVYNNAPSIREDIQSLLSVEDKHSLEAIFNYADNVRRQHMGEGILLRGIIEFSNMCSNTCFYCGLNIDNTDLVRYRLTEGQLYSSLSELSSYGIKTVVLQSGEDASLDVNWLAHLVALIKKDFGIAVTLSVGERDYSDYQLWRCSGADRYLLKIEATDDKLYNSIHRQRSIGSRIRALQDLKRLGYQVGSGIMVGLPGQTTEMIAKDIMFFKEMDFDMIGIGPFIPHPQTVFAYEKQGDCILTLKTIALTRIAVKNAHMPATTALGTLGREHQLEALRVGANVLMPNFTPLPYRSLYDLYPNRKCKDEHSGRCVGCMDKMATDVDRRIDYSVGHSLKIKGGCYAKGTA